MVTQVSETQIVQSSAQQFTVHRWSRWCDGDGRLIIVVCLFGHDFTDRGQATMLELLNCDSEKTYDIGLEKFRKLVDAGKLVRIHTPIVF